MADARSLGLEGVERSKKEAADQNIIDIFVLYMQRVTYFVLHRDRDVFDGVYKAALENNDVALAAYRVRGMIDVFSSDQLPLTVSGKLAADGKFEAAKKLISFGANAELMLVGAASGGQAAFIDPRKHGDVSPWPLSDYENLRRMMLVAAAYHKQKGVIDLIGRYGGIYYHDVVMAAGLGGHFDYVEEIVISNKDNVITGLTECTFSRLRVSLAEKADGLRFLAQFHDDKFRADIANRLDEVRADANDKPGLAYEAAALVSDASCIRRLIDQQGLSYEAASVQVASRPYYTMASLAAHSLFATAGAYVGSAIEAAAELDQGRDDDFRNETRESCRIM